MSSFRQIGLGFLAAVFSTALVFGSMLLALVEGGKRVAFAPAFTPTNTVEIATPRPGEPTFTPSPSPTPTDTLPAPCPLTPQDWIDYLVLSGETLVTIGQDYNIPPERLFALNCLQSDGITGGIYLKVPSERLPATPTPTFTPIEPTSTQKKPDKPKASPKPQQACSGHPSGWVTYRIRQGENLFRIALAYGLSTQELMAKNCLGTNLIRAGQIIFVPGYPPRTTATRVPPTPRPTNDVPPPIPSDPPSPEPSEPPSPVPSEPPSPVPSEPPSPVPSEPPSPVPSEPPSPVPSEPPSPVPSEPPPPDPSEAPSPDPSDPPPSPNL